jgi:hypothetical protein
MLVGGGKLLGRARQRGGAERRRHKRKRARDRKENEVEPSGCPESRGE